MAAAEQPATTIPLATATCSAQWTHSSIAVEDDDSGMFSYLPPGTANTQPSPGLSSFSRGNTGFSVAVNPTGSGEGELSAAATYALAAKSGRMPPTRDGLPLSSLKEERRRDSDEESDWVRGHTQGDYGSQWEDQARSDTSSAFEIGGGGGLQQEGIEMVTRTHTPTRSEDEKMIAEFDAMRGLHHVPGYGFEDDEEDSPYPEVRASVSNYDDMDMPVLTFRTWALGIFFGCLIGGLNSFFTFRYPAPYVTPIIAQVVSYPCGKILAWLLPAKTWKMPDFLVRRGWDDTCSFNPGPFNIKEHTVILMMTTASSSPAYGLYFAVTTEKFYGRPQGIGLDILIVLCTQMIGFGIAGLCRRFLVWPASLIWPQNLLYCTLLNTLHAEDDTMDDGGGVSRYRFFIWVSIASFFYYFLPGFLFQALSAFSYICWATPNNRVVNQLFGVSSGLGMGLLTFDWAQISYIGTPLIVPWWAQVNIFVGFVISFWLIAPIMYYNNVWFAAYLPISTPQVFDRFGAPYDTSAVVDIGNLALNITAYNEYSPLYLPITYTALYGIAFALSTAVIVHTALYHGKEMVARIRTMSTEDKDIHFKLMSHYPEVPEWWYMLYLAIFTGVSIGVIYTWDVQTPLWSLILAIVVGFIYVLPGGFIYAMTTQQISVNLIVELMAGYMLPGKPLGNMLFKIYSLQCVGFALTFVQDLKLGHYMKIPPRATFAAQVVAAFLSCLVQVGIKEWLYHSVPDLCSPDQSAHLVCPYASVFYSSSITWGLIGPARQFGIGKMYNPLLWWLLVGAVLPVPFWYASKRYPNIGWLKLVNIPVLLVGGLSAPPATGINYSSWFLFGFIFQYLARRKYFRWWAKFNFILSAGLDCGTVLCTIIIFVVLQLPKGGTLSVNWKGNTIFMETDDWNGVPYLTPPLDGFGPTVW